MADIVSPEKRSQMMAGIRNSNTRIEVAIRKALFARGFRYRLHAKTIPGKPDIILPRYRTAVFVHGCFWHGHNCSLFKVPGTRTDFWLGKIQSNRNRDSVVTEQIAAAGYRQITVWECAVRGATLDEFERVIDRLTDLLVSDVQYGEIRGSKYLADQQSS